MWVTTRGSAVYPNMYIVLAAPPGVGKSEITWRVRELFHNLEGHFVASTSVTKASMMDELAAATRRIVTNSPTQPVVSFNSLKLVVNELGVLIPGYDNEFMNTLTDLWDCKDYSESRRHSKGKEPINIQKTQLSMLAACTPSYLVDLLPEGAWDQGFISRTFLIYSGDRQVRSLFADQDSSMEEMSGLQKDLERISNLYGEMSWTKEAATLIDDFNMRDGEPAPEHPKLMSYNIRRTVHLIKLCMVASVSESDDLVIRAEHFQRAFDWMIEAESFMPDIFKAMSTGGTGKVMEDAWYYLYTVYRKEDKPVLVHRLIRFLQERVPVHQIEPTIKMMENGKMIQKTLTSAGACYTPKGRDKK